MGAKIWDPATGFRAVRWLWEEWADGPTRRAVAAGVAAGLASTLSPLFKAVVMLIRWVSRLVLWFVDKVFSVSVAGTTGHDAVASISGFAGSVVKTWDATLGRIVDLDPYFVFLLFDLAPVWIVLAITSYSLGLGVASLRGVVVQNVDANPL